MVGADVRFRPTVVSVEGLEHVTIQPTPEPTQFDPLFSTDSSVGISTEPGAAAGARLQELVAQMRKLLQALAGDHTVLIATHNLSEVRQTCGHLLVLHGGALMAQGTERELCLGAGGPPAMLLEVRGEPEPVERLLASSPHISSHSRAAVEEGLSRWRIAASEADRGGLMAQLRAQGLEAQWGGEARRTLEEAFLDLVGGTQS